MTVLQPPAVTAELPEPPSRHEQRWARRFGPASEEPFRRRTTDGFRLLIAIAVVAVLAHQVGKFSPLQKAFIDASRQLPGDLHSLALVLEKVSTLWVAALLVVVALGARRWRLARDLLIAGALGWLVARGLGLAAGGDLRHHLGTVLDRGPTPHFPDVRVALVTAVLSTSLPYVGRATRRIGFGFLVVLMVSELYLDVALFRDLLAGLFVGYGVAAAVHLAFGSPGGRPTAEQVRISLADLGVRARNVRLATEQPGGGTLFLAEDDTGDLHLTLLGRDETDAQVLTKVWRALLYRDGGPRLILSRKHLVEHQAYVLLLAADRGALVPRVAAAGIGGPAAAVLAERVPTGVPLASLAEVDDRLLDAIWREVHALATATITHGRLTSSRIVVTPLGPVLTGFSRAETGRDVLDRASDVAELLATTAALVGPLRAVDSAARVLPAEDLAAALPVLQPLALSREGRGLIGRNRREQRVALDGLRAVTAELLGVTAPDLVQVRRVSPRTLILALGTLVGVFGLLGQVSNVSAVINAARNARALPVVYAIALAFAAALGYAIAFIGSVPRPLPFWSTLKLQITGPFANLALPVGAQAVQVRFLQQQGLSVAGAVAATGVVSTGLGVVIQVAIFLVASAVSPRPLELNLLPQGAIPALLLGSAITILVGSLVFLLAGRLRARIAREFALAWTTVREVLKSPRLLVLQVFGNVLVAFTFGLSLAACLSAYGQSLPLSTILAVNIAVTTVAMVVPIPGGGTAVGSVGLSGALIALGIPEAPAVGVVLLSQLSTSYLPAVPGWLVLRNMLKREEL